MILSACGLLCVCVCVLSMTWKMKGMVLLVFFFQIGFAAVDAVTGLKLIEGGIPRETIAFLALAAVPIQVVLPAVLRYSAYNPSFVCNRIKVI